ncbi:MAG: helix-turn-helix domain-containing protein [Candidatus Aenigmarchaeota archaeon]|nr:helix-turn-helix domain-containing protein [Candidatus Aenigmarchaeota archaeon]
MFDKTILMSKVLDILHNNGFETFVTNGSFDIVAKRENLFLIKVLMNIDSLDESHALDLRAISHFLSAYPFVISIRNNREHLDDEIVYTRFDLPATTPKLFQLMLQDDNIEVIHSSKGRHTQEVNVFNLKETRKQIGYTLEQLANRVGISKKAMYEIESKRVNPQQGTVRKLESVLKIELRMPYELKHAEPVHLKPKDNFGKSVSDELNRLGIDNSSVNSAPFELIGRENFSLITNLSNTPSDIKHEIIEMKKLSEISESKAVLISKRTIKESIEGIPIISENELSEIKHSKELGKIIDERIG